MPQSELLPEVSFPPTSWQRSNFPGLGAGGSQVEALGGCPLLLACASGCAHVGTGQRGSRSPQTHVPAPPFHGRACG